MLLNRHISIQHFGEIFPVNIERLPELYAYRLQGRSEALAAVGGRVAYRLKRMLSGHWVWSDHHVVTDRPAIAGDVQDVLQELWRDEPEDFREIEAIEPASGWVLTPQAQADFAARGLLGDLQSQMAQELTSKGVVIGRVMVERLFAIRGWVVGGKPAVSISISSHLIFREALKVVAERSADDLVGLWVCDRISTSMKGEITEIIGPLRQHRGRLLAVTKREEMVRLIQAAGDFELVVKVRSGHYYDYVASALNIILRMEDLERFGIPARRAVDELRLAPQKRRDMLRPLVRMALNRQIIDNAFTSKSCPNLFLNARDIGFEPQLRFGSGVVHPYPSSGLLPLVQQYGLYRRRDCFENTSIRIGVLNAATIPLQGLLSALRNELGKLRLNIEFLPEERVSTRGRDEFERTVQRCEQHAPDILLCVLPDETTEEKEWSLYYSLKSIMVARGLASQFVFRRTVDNSYAVGNIVLGIIGKTGNIPFVLGERLPYADIVVGIDIARERKRRLSGSMNATAIARVYFSDGDFLRYVICDAPLEGETIPEQILQSFCPVQEFGGKRVVFHRDGLFRGNEKLVLTDWGNKIGATFHLVEILKSGTPRLYTHQGKEVLQPKKGTTLKLSDQEAFLISTLPPFQNATPQPLRILTEPPFSIEEGLHSVLSLTLLHYGSLRPPRLPITIHYSDKIAHLALRGIKPKDLEGNLPYWL